VGNRRIVLPVSVGLVAGACLSLLYFAIVSWAESPRHALEQFWTDRWIVLPIVVGFGLQSALYTILKKRLYLPVASPDPSGALMGAGGTTSTAAMIACCAHHVSDVLPLVGLTAASAFLAQYRTTFMLVGLATTLTGIVLMLAILMKERRRANHVPLAAQLLEAG